MFDWSFVSKMKQNEQVVRRQLCFYSIVWHNMCLTINLQCSEKSSSGKGFKRIAKKGHTAVNAVYFISSRITYRAIPIPCNANVRWFTSRINFCFVSHTWLHPWIYSELACVASVPVRTNFSAFWPRGREQKIGGRGWEWHPPIFCSRPNFRATRMRKNSFVRERLLRRLIPSWT